jgi:hypothetical protein
MLSNLFPTEIRYSGIAMSYNLAYAVCGGLSPLVCTFLIHYFDSALAPAAYIIFIASIAWMACILL